MVSGPTRVIIADVGTEADYRFNRSKDIRSAKCLVLNIDFVGIQTQQLGQTQGYKLSYSIEIPRIHYNAEVYCYFDNEVYEVVSISKAKKSTNMLLNVAKKKDDELAELFKKWIKENLHDKQ